MLAGGRNAVPFTCTHWTLGFYAFYGIFLFKIYNWLLEFNLNFNRFFNPMEKLQTNIILVGMDWIYFERE